MSLPPTQNWIFEEKVESFYQIDTCHDYFLSTKIIFDTLCSILMFYRVQQVHEKWVNVRTLLQTKLINILNIHTNPDFKFLAECTEWVVKKLVSVEHDCTNIVLLLV